MWPQRLSGRSRWRVARLHVRPASNLDASIISAQISYFRVVIPVFLLYAINCWALIAGMGPMAAIPLEARRFQAFSTITDPSGRLQRRGPVLRQSINGLR